MRRNTRRFRVKVIPRTAQRKRRNRIVVSVLFVSILAGFAYATVKHFARDIGNPFVALKNNLSPSMMAVEVVADNAAIVPLAQAYLETRGRLSPAAQASALKDKFTFLKSVNVRRDWLRRKARLLLESRAAVAAARPVGYLSDDGVVFDAPDGLYAVVGPTVETKGARKEDLAVAAKIALAAARPGAFPAPLVSLKLAPGFEGWEAALADGTTVLWGDGRWTELKLSRLKEVLADARAQSDSGARYAADLRFFEDGKVLLRPLSSRTVSLR